MRGDAADDLFRRFHGREIFDHAWNGYRIDGRTITFEVDDDPDPAWLDVDGLRDEVVATMNAAPDENVARPDRGESRVGRWPPTCRSRPWAGRPFARWTRTPRSLIRSAWRDAA